MSGAFTIPARLARPATISRSSEEARKRVIQLYRDWYRSVSFYTSKFLHNATCIENGDPKAPEIVSIYSLNMSPAFVRHQIRKKFERNRDVTDLRAIEVLIHKSRLEYQETINIWKMPDHVTGLLLNEKARPPKTFLQKFYEGRDEEAIVPAASGVA
ncbi:ndufa6 NADH-ubiquinone oxidoreductase subunit [Marasmius crinis-equi]|uniref:Ndufa6 NADH-ubiquinone oxidoreductase subunit n=1 Tax=Marasmius crinis-equi TaxID=585013 RepID=A0ABR3FLM1_9AGAR